MGRNLSVDAQAFERLVERICRRLSRFASWPGLFDENGLAVVLKFFNRFKDVCEGSMAAILFWHVEVNPRIPSATQLFNRRDVDVSIVKVAVELGHVAVDEHSVCADSVAG